CDQRPVGGYRVASSGNSRSLRRDRVAVAAVEVLHIQPQSVSRLAAGEQNLLAVGKPVGPQVAVEPRVWKVARVARTDGQDAESKGDQPLKQCRPPVRRHAEHTDITQRHGGGRIGLSKIGTKARLSVFSNHEDASVG